MKLNWRPPGTVENKSVLNNDTQPILDLNNDKNTSSIIITLPYHFLTLITTLIHLLTLITTLSRFLTLITTCLKKFDFYEFNMKMNTSIKLRLTEELHLSSQNHQCAKFLNKILFFPFSQDMSLLGSKIG